MSVLLADPYILLRWAHIVGSTVLFGLGAGTAYYMWSAHLTGDPRTIASVGRMVVRADWIFTLGSGIAQPISGAALIWHVGHDPLAPWLVLSYSLFALAFICWVPVVTLQIRATRLAEAAIAEGMSTLGPDYRRCMRLWFLLGWPAFLGLMAIFRLMIAKPQLW